MQHLPFPVTAAEDEKVVTILAGAATWEPLRSDWIAAYRDYRTHGGSPFAVHPRDFGQAARDLQYKLYDSRKSSGMLARMRRQAGLKSCPVCGSPVTGDLDHYLPRDSYPEFSIMRVNLVPACHHCNSGVKGGKVHGGVPRRFIHPYFDQWAASPMWFVEIVPPYEAATFKPRPLPSMPQPQGEIVEFHLQNVLGSQFQLYMANEWSSLPGQIKLRNPEPSTAGVSRQVGIELAVALHATGTNSWKAALMRGVHDDQAAIEYLRHKAADAVLAHQEHRVFDRTQPKPDPALWAG